MKKITILVLVMVLGLSLNGVIFAKDGIMVSDKPGLMMSDKPGLMLSDKTGLMMSDLGGEENTCPALDDSAGRPGLMLSDFYEWIFGESDDKDCE